MHSIDMHVLYLAMNHSIWKNSLLNKEAFWANVVLPTYQKGCQQHQSKRETSKRLQCYQNWNLTANIRTPACAVLSLCSRTEVEETTAGASEPLSPATSLKKKTSIWQPCLVANIKTKLFHDLTTKCIHIADTEETHLCLRAGTWISWGINHVQCLPEVWYSASI